MEAFAAARSWEGGQPAYSITFNPATATHSIRVADGGVSGGGQGHDKSTIELPDKVYRKLTKRFSATQALPTVDVNDAIFCVLLRYHTLGGLSHQWAMVPEMKDYLATTFSVEVCSPHKCTCKRTRGIPLWLPFLHTYGLSCF